MSTDRSKQNVVGELENNDYRLRRLFDGCVFNIPEYQRFYSWEKAQWSDLWNDLSNVVDDEREHYMGTVVLMDEDNPITTGEYSDDYREYAIVDGQQRFTTLILLVRAIVAKHESIDEGDLSDQEKNQYDKIPIKESRELFVIDPKIEPSNDGYEVRNKLKLQDDDHWRLKNILRGNLSDTTTTPSQRRLAEAYEFYCKRLDKMWEDKSPLDFLHRIGQLLSGIQSLRFMAYTIDDFAQATLIFESINDRGKGLSNLDKTKSFLMHKVYLARSKSDIQEVTIDEVQGRFGEIYKLMQNIETTDRISNVGEDQIQRYHYIANINQSVNRKYISNETDRRNLNLPSGATVYLGALKWHFTNLHNGTARSAYNSDQPECIEAIDLYTRGLVRYYSHMLSIGSYGQGGEYNSDIEWELKKIFALDRVGNFYPLLLALWDEYEEGRLSEDKMSDILQLLEVASFRIYTTVTRSDTGQSDFYNLANKVADGEQDADVIMSEIKSLIRDHENDFEDLLRDQNAYNRIRNKDIRYLLYSYELYLRDEGKGGGETSIEKAAENAGNDYTLDHIWPQDTSELTLADDETEIHDDIKHSLGNLTLTTVTRNSGWKNLPFHKKRDRREKDGEGYQNSDFTMTRTIAQEHDSWGKDQINQQLDHVIEFAKQRWSLDSDERQSKASIKPSEVER